MRFSLQTMFLALGLVGVTCCILFFSLANTDIENTKNVEYEDVSAEHHSEEFTAEYQQSDQNRESSFHLKSQSGKLIKVESEPGSYYLTVQNKSGQEIVLNTPTLLRATMFGPPEIGDEIYWQVRALDDDVHSRLLNKTFKKVYFVKLNPWLPQSGVIKSVNRTTDGLEILVSSNVAGKGNVELLLQYISKADIEKVQLAEGSVIGWERSTLISPSLTEKEIPQIATSIISKVKK